MARRESVARAHGHPHLAYAQERLGGSADELAGRHADFFLALLQEAYPERLARETEWLDRLAAELDNLRAALDWLHQHDRPKELLLCGAVSWVLLARSFILMLTQILVAEGDIDQAEPLAREMLAGTLELGSTRNEHFAQHYLGDCALLRGDAAAAEPRYRRSLETAVSLGDRVEVFTELQGVAMSLAGVGETRRALCLGGSAEAGFESLGVDLSGVAFWVELLDRYLGSAREELGDDDWNEGRGLDLEQAVELALSDR